MIFLQTLQFSFKKFPSIETPYLQETSPLFLGEFLGFVL